MTGKVDDLFSYWFPDSETKPKDKPLKDTVSNVGGQALSRQALWEPWQPQLGDEVEVWISAECICVYCGDNAHGARWDPAFGYKGTVRDIRRADNVGCRSCGLYIPGHYYLVMGAHMGDELRKAGGWAAAIEMRKVNT